MKQLLLLLVLVFGFASLAFATHNRAGEISYRKVLPDDPNDFQYEITIVTCTKASSPADRPWLTVRFGDEAVGEELDSIPRINTIPEVGIINPDDSRLNFYSAVHTYPGPGTYIISMEDPNRNGGVINMDESISQVFYIESMLNISPFGGHNNSVRLLYPAKDEACINSIWEHNPGAYDIDGDSLSYSLVSCRGLMGEVIPSWVPPNLIEESSDIDDIFSIDSETGTITWDAPAVAGEYNIAIRINEFRNGFLVGYVVRDMQVRATLCSNQPPEVESVQDLCVIAGEELNFSVTATDDNTFVTLEAFGAPISEVENLADFDDFSGNPATGNFSWTPQCPEVRPAPYQVLIVGTDSDPSTELVDITEVNITVIAPKVENLAVDPVGLSFELDWDDHICEDEVVSYKIYRRDGFYGYVPAECETGVPEYTGYEFLADVGADQTSYTDTQGVDFGKEFCYMIVACLLNGSESIASDEMCATILDLTRPVLTKNSVGPTDLSEGKDTIRWVPPIDGDTILLSPPFKFNLYHSTGFNSASTLIYETPENNLISSLEREYIHELIDTESTPNSYRIELEDANGTLLGSSSSSTVYLSITPDDNQLLLSWDSNTSWTNTLYEIFRFNDLTAEYELIGSTIQDFYVDTGLINNVDYCYYVKSIGEYNSEFTILPNPIINYSQELCSFPVDLTAPCAPELSGDGNCEEGTIELTWNNPNESCADDVTAYNIYFKPFIDAEYELIESFTGDNSTSFSYSSFENLTGCYYVTAVDSLLPGLEGIPNQNESLASNEFCFESCPEYELPNVFSPQGDGFNDIFEPFPYVYVDSIDLTIFNRWGTPVFETTDPDINWQGLNKDSGEISSDGVYFYVLKVYSSMLTGVREESFSGNVTLLGGKKIESD